jgi:hypothetical protein
MAVVADIDGLDLWVEPHHLTPEEQVELQRYIQDHREKHPLAESEKQAVQELLRRLRAGSEAAANPR